MASAEQIQTLRDAVTAAQAKAATAKAAKRAQNEKCVVERQQYDTLVAADLAAKSELDAANQALAAALAEA